MARKSIRAALMRAAAFGVMASAGMTISPEANAQCNTTGASADCDGDVSAGVSYTNNVITTLDIHDLTAPIAPAPGVSGVVLRVEREFDAFNPLTVSLSLDDSVHVIASGANSAVRAEGLGDYSYIDGGRDGTAPSVFVNSAATIAYNSNRAESVRGTPIQLFTIQNNIAAGDAIREAFETTTPTAGQLALREDWNCVVAVGEFLCHNVLQPLEADPDDDDDGILDAADDDDDNDGVLDEDDDDFITYADFVPPQDNRVLLPAILDYIANQRSDYVYWSAPTPPEQLGVNNISAAIAALSIAQGDDFFGLDPNGTTAHGGDVNVLNTGAIETFGANTMGVWAESRGGERAETGVGGDITITNNGQIVTHGGSSVGVFARSIGAADDMASDGGQVLIQGDGDITTFGHSAYGVFAVSAGGDGRNDETWHAGDGGLAEIIYGGSITTYGANGVGIYGLSYGGFGWEGGDGSTGDAANTGGWGGHGGDVYVEILDGASVVTYGDNSSAIVARSRGGRGGEGGNTNVIDAAPGRGGPGGNSGRIDVLNHAVIQTYGANAYGVFAQSAAGAGGPGGNHDNLLTGSGQDGGPAGHGGDIYVDNFGVITTSGRRAYGVYAQSLGGDGGAGGDGSGAFNSSGGDGGTAASGRCLIDLVCPDGGNVYVTNHDGALIHTEGLGAHAIFAQSIGGGGGQGGDASGWLWISGGGGGDAGDGLFVDVDNEAALVAEGVGAFGIFAQSIGGGGGAGGDAFGVGPYAAIAIGGRGGAGGNGGQVEATNSGSILVLGERSNGVFAQSIGGGGGVGGSATAIAGGPGAAASVAIGGDGEAGGDGDRVDVDNFGSIEVHGDFSNGVFAQSVGGGGGAGGSSYSYAFAGGDQFSLAAAISLGGAGSGGGDGDIVDVRNTGSIITYDFNSVGIVAQSVGGGGGVGGSSMAQSVTANARKGIEISMSVAIGGRGGDGGVGGDVFVTNEGSVATLGDQSTAIFAQSVGGGGGLGGDASSGAQSMSQTESTSVEVEVSVGGAGGSGDDGGNVTVTNKVGADIITLGAMSNGITAQSVGGGGGVGGSGDQSTLFESLGLPEPPDVEFEDTSDPSRRRARERYADLQDEVGDIPDSDGSHGRKSRRQQGSERQPQSFGVGLSIGGKGGSGGDGRAVLVENSGEILTGGVMSMGVFAQSIGGGGGSGGAGRGTAAGDISIGGGIGGGGGAAGDGGTVTVNNFGAITTLQAMSYGVFAQSVGGGGGIGGLGAGEHDTMTSMSLSVGGAGGSSGTGGAVEAHQTGDVITFGDGAIGVLAQSVGGGGGIGGAAEESTFGSINIGGKGGSGGDGGTVLVTVDGNIATEGDFAHGVFAQSVGGGGGLGGNIETRTISFGDPFGLMEFDTGIALSVGNLSFAGSGGSAGDGQTVTVETTGTISTFGKNAHGIFAQSIGGGGGAGGSDSDAPGLSFGFSGSNGGSGTAGAITITHDGDIRTYGENSIGIMAQSMGGADVGYRGGNIEITLNGGEIRGGSGEAGAGVMVSGGATNTITNNGGLISATSGIAIAATEGDDHVVNSGRIEGAVGLGSGDNSFLNTETGVFASGAAVNIGGGPLMNLGDMTPFGEHVSGETRIAGDYAQDETGMLSADLVFGGPSDLVTVFGDAFLAGDVRPVIGHVADLEVGQYVTVLDADFIVDDGISIDLSDTLVIDYASRIEDDTELQIGIADLNYDIGGLSGSQRSLAGHLQSVWGAGGSDSLHQLMDYLGSLTDADEYAQTLQGIHPFASFSAGGQTLVSNQTFLTGLLSCPDGDLHERQCVWVRGGDIDGRQESQGGDPGYEQDSSRYQVGAQFDAGGGWFAGFSFGYETGRFSADNAAVTESQSLMLGAVVKRETGPWLFAAAFDYVRIEHDRQRLVTFPSPAIATSENRDDVLAGRLRVAYLVDRGAFYLRPSLDLDLYAISSGRFTETGAGAMNLRVGEDNNTIGAAELSLEVGGRIVDGNSVIRPFAQVGVNALSDHSIDVTARFEGAPLTASGFTVSSRLPDTLVRGRVGVDWSYAGGGLRLEYEQRSGDGYEDASFSAKLRVSF